VGAGNAMPRDWTARGVADRWATATVLGGCAGWQVGLGGTAPVERIQINPK
jgi:hypothetical protein